MAKVITYADIKPEILAISAKGARVIVNGIEAIVVTDEMLDEIDRVKQERQAKQNELEGSQKFNTNE